MKTHARGQAALRSVASVFLASMLLGFLPLLTGSAVATHGGVHIERQPDTNGCQGVLPTKGSENTTKRLDPNFPSDFNPGGTVGYIIDYTVDPSDVAGRRTFVITD